ncbi:hypothetical protein N9N67_09135, partial [Bacteriovoracaceae bacterium]|nr:hypothetical protein [Bacteriovoracaceae bacterium]
KRNWYLKFLNKSLNKSLRNSNIKKTKPKTKNYVLDTVVLSLSTGVQFSLFGLLSLNPSTNFEFHIKVEN